jgi:hypothetical protein
LDPEFRPVGFRVFRLLFFNLQVPSGSLPVLRHKAALKRETNCSVDLRSTAAVGDRRSRSAVGDRRYSTAALAGGKFRAQARPYTGRRWATFTLRLPADNRRECG